MRIRPIVPDDSAALQEFVGNMSTETSYFRFFRVKHELTPDELAAFTAVDYSKEMAFVAIVDGELVGVGRYSSTDDDGVSVQDRRVRSGVGHHRVRCLRIVGQSRNDAGVPQRRLPTSP